MLTPSAAHEFHFCLVLHGTRSVNHEWLEDQAIRLEDALIDRGSHLAAGFSVSANFEDHGFEIDYSVETDDLSELYNRTSQIARIAQDVIGFSLEPSEQAEATASATVAVPA